MEQIVGFFHKDFKKVQKNGANIYYHLSFKRCGAFGTAKPVAWREVEQWSKVSDMNTLVDSICVALWLRESATWLLIS